MFFFFFKQKTAYEIYQCDWSSDVCSSDLLYVAGNGGSAATASHIQADFQFFVRYFTDFRPRVVALTDNVPLMTAISNDNSYEDVFVEQMKEIGRASCRERV